MPRRLQVVAVAVFALLIAGLAIRTSLDSPMTSKLVVRTASKSREFSERSRVGEPLIRVNVTPGGVDSFRLQVRGPSELKSLDKDEQLVERLNNSTITVSSTKSGLRLGSRQYSTNQLEIVPVQSPAIRVNGHLYRGTIRLFLRKDGKVSAVNVLPIEDYLASVVDSEMPAKFPEAAREAQAIVARTYALYQKEQADPHSVFDLLSSQRSQKYQGVEYLDVSGRRLAGESDSSRRVVQATRGLVCQSHKKLFCTYYSAVCGGQTTNGRELFKDAIDVVKTVPCDWCRDSPYYRWTTELPLDEFHLRAFRQAESGGKDVVVRSIRQLIEPSHGAISQFELDIGLERLKLSGTELRERLPAGTLWSPHFRIKLEKTRIVFEGRGHGHGVGFCQWGAKGQAEDGRSSLEIVRHYFPGADLTVLEYE